MRREMATRNLDGKIDSRHFTAHKRRAIAIERCLDAQADIAEDEKEKLVSDILADEAFFHTSQKQKTTGFGWALKIFSASTDIDEEQAVIARAIDEANAISDPEFLAGLADRVARIPLLTDLAHEMLDIVYDKVSIAIRKAVEKLMSPVEMIQKEYCVLQIDREAASQREVSLKDSRLRFFDDMEAQPRTEKL